MKHVLPMFRKPATLRLRKEKSNLYNSIFVDDPFLIFYAFCSAMMLLMILSCAIYPLLVLINLAEASIVFPTDFP